MTDTSKQMKADAANLPERVELHRKVKERDGAGTLDNDIILVFLPWNTVTPFVTWLETIDNGATMHGHYHTDVGKAYHDFTAR